ncbi:fructose-1,6-bisphosphatase II [Desulfonatronum thiosulfatophilum]|uniref:Fructose-1,6-bisphosphatase n=1 Tax=Desulfonatronum thiosulfatophilum TaxID=617002 RepID=A0A1G6BXL3_9BACT|nr:class II fructose-bisphosphatase [Desulfonatronum thiosulfatophilum]SDB25355.1 fructose-1,6-bisphosphatase II [Desulfonatronum thiosulfatophilum]
MSQETPQRNLALDLVRVTEAAALASSRWLGKGDKEHGDFAAVEAMRLSFSAIDIKGTVVIGEGEKDEAPMLYNGEKLGTGNGPEVDVAVDPVEGTRLLAFGRPNAIAVVALAPRGTMYNPGPAFYMKKMTVPSEAKYQVDIKAPVAENLRRVAKALGKSVDDMVVFVLDKPRHAGLIREIREAGARIQLHTDGDVAGALMAITPGGEVDMMIGTGGTPEGILAAVAIRIMGGEMQCMLDPQSDAERESVQQAGYSLERVLTVDDLVKSDDVFFAATGISGGTFLKGVEFTGKGAVTHSMVMRGKTGTFRLIEAQHSFSKLMRISAIEYGTKNERA